MSKSPISKRDTPAVSLWLVDASQFSDDDLAFFACLLGPSESDRYQRFVRPERRRQFLTGRMLLRFAVGTAIELPPSEIAIFEQPAGAPQLVLPESARVKPGFSLSHSGKWVACAVSRDTSLGVDIEVINPNRDLHAIGQSVFHAKEVALLETLHGEDLVATFYHLWSLREALFKLRSNAGSTARFPELLDEKNAIASDADGWHSHVFVDPELSCVLCSDRPVSLLPLSRPTNLSPAALFAAMHSDCAVLNPKD